MIEPGGDEQLVTPRDDGAARHLPGMELPGICLAATDGTTVDLREPGLTVVYAYPGQARPEERRLTDGTQYPARGDVHRSPVPFVIISLN